MDTCTGKVKRTEPHITMNAGDRKGKKINPSFNLNTHVVNVVRNWSKLLYVEDVEVGLYVVDVELQLRW
jgi:hypothetical protein